MRKSWFPVVIVIFASLYNGAAATQGDYRPLSGEKAEELLNKFMPPARVGKDARFAFTLRILPPFSSACQITIAYSYRSTAVITVTETIRPWDETTDYVARNEDKAELAELQRLFPVTMQRKEVGRDSAHAILEGFWRSLREMTHSGVTNALRNDGTDLVTITLDATLYEVRFQDGMTYVRVSVPGPNPDKRQSVPPGEVDPLVKWILSIREQFRGKGGSEFQN